VLAVVNFAFSGANMFAFLVPFYLPDASMCQPAHPSMAG
jgi:hypothetical protein